MASASDEEPLDDEGNITPRKSGAPVPRVQVDDASPPRPTQRAKIVATGDVCIHLYPYPLFSAYLSFRTGVVTFRVGLTIVCLLRTYVSPLSFVSGQ
jgi:hypothetical protein